MLKIGAFWEALSKFSRHSTRFPPRQVHRRVWEGARETKGGSSRGSRTLLHECLRAPATPASLRAKRHMLKRRTHFTRTLASVPHGILLVRVRVETENFLKTLPPMFSAVLLSEAEKYYRSVITVVVLVCRPSVYLLGM